MTSEFNQGFNRDLPWPTHDWRHADPQELGLELDALSRVDDAARSATPRIESLLIVRHGLVVFEAYYQGIQADTYLSISSITKSVISALIGVALARGLLSNLDQSVYDFFPEYVSAADDDPRKRSITVRHLLCMTAGYANQLPPNFYLNVVRSALARPLEHAPGTRFRYDSQGVDVLSAILTRLTGQPAAVFAQRTLFAAMGIWQQDNARFRWKTDADGPHIWHDDGAWDETHGLPWKSDAQGNSTGGFGAHFTTRDLAKLGLLYASGGVWAGETLLPDSYLRDSTSQQSEGGWPEYAPYGYLWWVQSPRRAPQGSQPPALYEAFYGSGYGGKYLYVVPSLDLVVVLLSPSRQGPGERHRDLITDVIIPAIAAARP